MYWHVLLIVGLGLGLSVFLFTNTQYILPRVRKEVESQLCLFASGRFIFSKCICLLGVYVMVPHGSFNSCSYVTFTTL